MNVSRTAREADIKAIKDLGAKAVIFLCEISLCITKKQY